jgi:hypothetical protein
MDKYINLDKAMKQIRDAYQAGSLYTPDDVYQLLRDIRFLDGFHMVTCENCKYYKHGYSNSGNPLWFECVKDVIDLPAPDDYCSLGVFRDDGNASN